MFATKITGGWRVWVSFRPSRSFSSRPSIGLVLLHELTYLRPANKGSVPPSRSSRIAGLGGNGLLTSRPGR
jgi:hypothetical protein